MASKLDLGAVHCARDPSLGDALLRDGVDPVVLTEKLLGLGYTLETVERLLIAYYGRSVETELRSGPSSNGSSRSARSVAFFSRCDEWLVKPGYCYTAIVRPSQRQRVANFFGKNAQLSDLFRIPEGDIAWQRLVEVKVEKLDSWNVHLSYDRGSASFVSHMAAFAADFPTLVPLHWRRYLSDVAPVEESWFGMTTRFGVDRESLVPLNVPEFLEFSCIAYSGPEYKGVRSERDFFLEAVIPKKIDVPVGMLLKAQGEIVVDTLTAPAVVLAYGLVDWQVCKGDKAALRVTDYGYDNPAHTAILEDLLQIKLHVSRKYLFADFALLLRSSPSVGVKGGGRVLLQDYEPPDDLVTYMEQTGYLPISKLLENVGSVGLDASMRFEPEVLDSQLINDDVMLLTDDEKLVDDFIRFHRHRQVHIIRFASNVALEFVQCVSRLLSSVGHDRVAVIADSDFPYVSEFPVHRVIKCRC